MPAFNSAFSSAFNILTNILFVYNVETLAIIQTIKASLTEAEFVTNVNSISFELQPIKIEGQLGQNIKG